LFAEVVFTAPYAGLQSVRVGSAHLNNVRAKRFDVATGCLETLLQRATDLNIDIIGVDLNQGATKSAGRGISPLGPAFMNMGASTTEPQTLLGPGAEDDCVGFLIPRGSRLWQSCALTRISYFCLLNNDIGLRRSDEGTHRPVLAHFRVQGEKNLRQRDAATEVERKRRATKARRQRKSQEEAKPGRVLPGLVLSSIDVVESDEAELEEEF
jgi:hypothetical protein